MKIAPTVNVQNDNQIMKCPDRKRVSQLEALPNIGKAIGKDLRLIGIVSPQQLIGADAFALYNWLCEKTGQRRDPCVIDVFLAAINFMEGGEPLPWWKFTSKRKLMLKTGSTS